MLIVCLAAAVCVGSFVGFIAHRREKCRRPPHAYQRGFWAGT